jgi:hypothetical protein
MITPEQVRELRKAEQEATPGPWRTGRKVGRTIYPESPDAATDAGNLMGVMDVPADARLVVAMRNAFPALLDALARPPIQALIGYGDAVLVDENAALQKRLDAALAALQACVDDLEETLIYAPEYFREKWDLGGSLATARAVFTAAKEPTP